MHASTLQAPSPSSLSCTVLLDGSAMSHASKSSASGTISSYIGSANCSHEALRTSCELHVHHAVAACTHMLAGHAQQQQCSHEGVLQCAQGEVAGPRVALEVCDLQHPVHGIAYRLWSHHIHNMLYAGKCLHAPRQVLDVSRTHMLYLLLPSGPPSRRKRRSPLSLPKTEIGSGAMRQMRQMAAPGTARTRHAAVPRIHSAMSAVLAYLSAPIS